MNFQVDEQFSVLIISVNYGNPSPVEDLIKSIEPNSSTGRYVTLFPNSSRCRVLY